MSTAVKERSIIFSKPMILAIDDNRKTQTRRLLNADRGCDCPENCWPFALKSVIEWRLQDGIWFGLDGYRTVATAKCPYGHVGDRLWVRVAWKFPKSLDALNSTQVAEKCLGAGYSKPWAPILYLADDERREWDRAIGEPGRYRTARFMPRWASRLTLEVKNIRVKRLQDITGDDAASEGVERKVFDQTIGFKNYLTDGWFVHWSDNKTWRDAAIESFKSLWYVINGEASWNANPWVWAVDFKRVNV